MPTRYSLGRELGLAGDDLDRLNWAALLHDIGKLEVSTEILNKPGKPTEEEWAELRQHPLHGETLVAPLRDWLGSWTEAVGYHHERWDGKGYPREIAGEEIPLRRTHRRDRRRVRRDHLGTLVQGGRRRRRGPGGDRALLRDAVRPAPRARIREHLPRQDAARDGPALVALACPRPRPSAADALDRRLHRRGGGNCNRSGDRPGRPLRAGAGRGTAGRGRSAGRRLRDRARRTGSGRGRTIRLPRRRPGTHPAARPTTDDQADRRADTWPGPGGAAVGTCPCSADTGRDGSRSRRT